MLAYIFIGLAGVFIAVYFLTRKATNILPSSASQKTTLQSPVKAEKISYGPLRIFFGSQTGTAAKLAEQLSEEAAEHGFEGEVVDLKVVSLHHFERKNEISLFLMSNTGEGDAPENAVRWMKVLRGKENLDEVGIVDWAKVNFSVFGLGNTQYEHYNTTGIACDENLAKLGAKRIYKLGLGDDNCSLEDDFTEWRRQLWAALKEFRVTHPIAQQIPESELPRKKSSEMSISEQYISEGQPLYANYRIFLKKGHNAHNVEQVQDEELDFKTKASLKSEKAIVKSIRQLRQNESDGSTLELQIEMTGQTEYQTAGNLALYSKNDPKIVNAILDYFNIKQADLDRKIGLTKLNEEKKYKLNFVPNTLRTLLEESIDLQGHLTKSTIKKLAKFESDNQKYFIDNSSLKTTEEYKRITQKAEGEHWYYLFRLISEHKVKLRFQDFIQLSDSMAPRLFTIASSVKAHSNVIVAASIVNNGLISKFFLSKPSELRAELRKSTFTQAMSWKKVIFIAAGTGLAPFRGYIQEKEFLFRQAKEGKQNIGMPIVTLFFGCKHENGDFIYKQQILKWKDEGIIDRLHLAFSRDTGKKVYVQNLLQAQEEQLKELGHCDETALYICGSLPMGNSIIEVLTKAFGAEKVKQMESQGRIVKELW